MMQYRRLGQSELEVSTVSLGLWQAGGAASWGDDFGEQDIIDAVHCGADVGINLLDTAPAYGGGGSEEILGRALKGCRDKFLVATKLSTNQITAEQVRASVEQSLQRLAIETIDLLQIHWPNTKDQPFAETIATMEALRQEGKIRALGVSNFTAPQLAECLETARVDSLQPPYNLLWRHIEGEILPFCREHEVGVLTYSPLAQGLLTGKYHHDNRPVDGTRPRNLLWHGEYFNIALQVNEILRDLAATHQATCAQVALAWLLHQPGVTSVIAGAKRPAQVQDNARAASLTLAADELTRLNDASEPLRAMTAGEFKMWFTGEAGDYDLR